MCWLNSFYLLSRPNRFEVSPRVNINQPKVRINKNSSMDHFKNNFRSNLSMVSMSQNSNDQQGYQSDEHGKNLD